MISLENCAKPGMEPNMDHSLHEKESCNLPCIILKSQKHFIMMIYYLLCFPKAVFLSLIMLMSILA